MIDLLDTLLRDLLLADGIGLTTEAQVRFQPPAQEWHTYVAGLGDQNALNIYLVELRENRKLRSNERVRSFQNGVVNETPAPQRIDCHYLITAWSPASVTTAIEPTLDEHWLLYQVTALLMRTIPFNPARVYPENSPQLAAWPEGLRDLELPAEILPVEGFPKYAELWGTMGQAQPWKPAIYLVVTLPVVLQTRESGWMVTTRISEYRQQGATPPHDQWIQIGGHVLDATNLQPNEAPRPKAGVWVQLQTLNNERLQMMQTDSLGRFTFAGLQEGAYQLQTEVPDLGEKIQPIDVPSSSGDYDVRFE
jgi:hypothetical protein